MVFHFKLVSSLVTPTYDKDDGIKITQINFKNIIISIFLKDKVVQDHSNHEIKCKIGHHAENDR